MSSHHKLKRLKLITDSPDNPSIYEVATNSRHTQSANIDHDIVSPEPFNIDQIDEHNDDSNSDDHSLDIDHDIDDDDHDNDSNLTHSDDSNEEHTSRQFKLFGNQVAGTLPILHSDGLIYKPLKTSLEQTFYQNICKWLPSITPFIPKYSGMEYIKINLDDEESVNSLYDEQENSDNNPWSTQMIKKNKHRIRKLPFLKLEDLTLKYQKPNILDLKIGTRHFAPICKTNKKERKLKKSWISTCRDFGVRIGGLQMYDNDLAEYAIMSKQAALRLSKDEFCAKISNFFVHGNKQNLEVFLQKLTKMFEILRDEHRFRWFSCSLLFVYEGFEHRIDDDTEFKCDDDEVDEERLDLKLIDFTNFVIVENYLEHQQNDEEDKDEGICQLDEELDNLEQPDHGILFGLEGLIKLLRELKERGSIKRRSEKEWNRFSERICWSKLALRPFANKKIFNENTTI